MTTAIAEYAGVLRARRRWIVWGLLLALGATTLFLLLRPPLYRSEATVLVRTPGDVSRVLDGGDSYAQARTKTYAALASSTDLAARVIADNGLDLTPEVLSKRITAHPRPGTALIDIAVSAPSSDEAERTATVFLSEYAARVHDLESVPGALVPRSELVVVDPPGTPRRVVAWGVPIPVVALSAALIGLVLGATAAVLRSIFDQSVRDPRDAARISAKPLLGMIGGEPTEQVTVDEHAALQRLLATMGNPDGGVITVTAPERSSATTRTAVTLASMLGERADSVVLVDLDLHTAELTQLLSDPERPGVTDVLGGRCTAEKATLEWTHGGFLGSGPATESTAGLIESVALRTLLAELRQRYAWIVLACPVVTYAVAIEDATDAIALAVREGVTTTANLCVASTLLPNTTACGVIFVRGTHSTGIELSEPRTAEAIG